MPDDTPKGSNTTNGNMNCTTVVAQIRPVVVTVMFALTETDGKLIEAKVSAFPRDMVNPSNTRYYWVPVYYVGVEGHDAAGKKLRASFAALRFGVQSKASETNPKGVDRVVGLADAQTHVVKSWRPNYIGETGAWVIIDGTGHYIHKGAPNSETAWGAIGCVEILGSASGGWSGFQKALLDFSGACTPQALAASQKLTVVLESAPRPPLKPAPPP